METTLYNQKGKEAGKISIPESVFGVSWNADLVHQVVASMMTSARDPIAHTKTRGEVRGGGKKPWQQKGTGQARHGSTRSPIWVGGGVAHGPRKDKNFDRKINRKMKAKALFTILSKKFRDGEVLFVDGVSFDTPKSKEARETLSNLGSIKGFEALSTKRKNAAYIATDKKDINVEKSFGNFSNIAVEELRNVNPLTMMKYKYLVITNPALSLATLSTKLS